HVVDACDGRTLGLFTSYRNLNAVYERLDGREHRVLRQGDLPRAELTRLFKEDVGSILLGTESFWTGIDVAGEALTGLVIDKLPFPPPDDPVIDAICERDPRAFDNYLVPLAIIALRQGDLPRAELTRLFKEDVGSILLGTESFWTGIDVAGEALTGLVIDKLPFPPPDDPVIDAICERDPRAFDNYLVPLAIIALRQG